MAETVHIRHPHPPGLLCGEAGNETISLEFYDRHILSVNSEDCCRGIRQRLCDTCVVQAGMITRSIAGLWPPCRFCGAPAHPGRSCADVHNKGGA